MAIAIIKLSYNQIGDLSLEGGICGTGFFISPDKAITAHHALNDHTFLPNLGYRECMVWVVSRQGLVRRIIPSEIKKYPQIDTSLISFKEKPSNVNIYSPSQTIINLGEILDCVGHVGDSMPQMNARWENGDFIISSVNLTANQDDRQSKVVSVGPMTVMANDISLYNVSGYRISNGSRVGMSGGPVLHMTTGQVVGMLSFGLPADSPIKTETFAIEIHEITSRVL